MTCMQHLFLSVPGGYWGPLVGACASWAFQVISLSWYRLSSGGLPTVSQLMWQLVAVPEITKSSQSATWAQGTPKRQSWRPGRADFGRLGVEVDVQSRRQMQMTAIRHVLRTGCQCLQSPVQGMLCRWKTGSVPGAHVECLSVLASSYRGLAKKGMRFAARSLKRQRRD